jgi:membrane associated rhomboid family serine protease
MQQSIEWVTFGIIISTGIITFLGFKTPSLFQRLMFDNQQIQQKKEYDRIITSGFLHADWMHFGFNMFSLYSFGKNIEQYYSSLTLFNIYFASVIGGNILSLVLYRNKLYRAIGASGGVCGVIFASIFLLPGGSIMIIPIPIAIPSWVYAILFLLISFYGIRSGKDNVGHIAHLGGALIGLAVTFMLFPQSVMALPELVGLIVLISAGILAYEYSRSKRLPKGY